ncbi:anti-sigma factor domain-containing protein [Neptunicella sp. SCSIO 80796]|uniref:anti-sigma factor n=1 Tax=Neptunicella plasticusilytica TaxID=3117012 RepID=UPI003A4E441D
MNYNAENLRNALAAEYVLGTLRGRARQRFQQLIMQFSGIRETTWIWEQHLNGLGTRLEPIEPADDVWPRIVATLGLETRSSQAEVVSLPTKRNGLWLGLTSLASAAAIILAVLLWRADAPSVIVEAQQVAVMQSENAETLWLIEISPDSIEVQATSQITPRPNNDYELWMVAKDGRPPISLGLLPQNGKLSLPKHKLFDQLDIAALAVSLEPLNGSPTGAPTQVLYSTKLVTI